MKNIKELRDFLGEAMREVKSGKLNIERARQISDLGKVIVESAKVEVDFIRQTNSKAPATDFINSGHLLDKKDEK